MFQTEMLHVNNHLLRQVEVGECFYVPSYTVGGVTALST